MDIHLLPKFLQVELTYACNSSCSFCYNPTHGGKIKQNILFDILDEINSYELNHVQLIGGEVTILPDLPAFLRRLDKVKWKSIVTNGRKYREDIKGLIDEIYVSLHGDKEMHEEITSEPGSYPIILENIKKYIDWGIDVNSDSVLTRYNYDQVFEIAQKAHDLGMKRMFLNIFQPEGIGSDRPDFSPSFEQIQVAITQMLRARDELSFEMNFGTSTPLCLDERLIRDGLGFKCGAGSWFGSISPVGEMRICNHSTKPYGNVVETPLNKIWHNVLINKDYRNAQINDPDCQGCPAYTECRGGCRIDENGLYRVDPIVTRDKAKLLAKTQIQDLINSRENEFLSEC